MITQRTILTTSAIALLGCAVLTWIMTDGAVGIVIRVLVVRVLVLLNCQSPLPQIKWRIPGIYPKITGSLGE